MRTGCASVTAVNKHRSFRSTIGCLSRSSPVFITRTAEFTPLRPAWCVFDPFFFRPFIAADKCKKPESFRRCCLPISITTSVYLPIACFYNSSKFACTRAIQLEFMWQTSGMVCPIPWQQTIFANREGYQIGLRRTRRVRYFVGRVYPSEGSECNSVSFADGNRSRATITKEQLSAAQLAVQRSLRGLTGAESSLPHDAEGPSSRESRSYKRSSAPSGSYVNSHERRTTSEHPSGQHLSGLETCHALLIYVSWS